MSQECTHECSSCGENCSERSLIAQLNPDSKVKKVIAVLSGKGGVGKSIVTSMLAVSMQRKGKRAAILDMDITGPSIPKAFGITEKASAGENGIYPALSKKGTQIMSVNLLLQNDTDPVVWRGPVISGVAKQFWTDVVWNDVDYMFVDMPPGTGDVALTAFQSLPLDGVIIVTSPQELVSMVVEKAVKMARMMNVPVMGLVENMSYILCPDCGKKIELFGKSNAQQVADKYGMPLLGVIPMEPALAACCDKGDIESFEGQWLDELAAALENL